MVGPKLKKSYWASSSPHSCVVFLLCVKTIYMYVWCVCVLRACPSIIANKLRNHANRKSISRNDVRILKNINQSMGFVTHWKWCHNLWVTGEMRPDWCMKDSAGHFHAFFDFEYYLEVAHEVATGETCLGEKNAYARQRVAYAHVTPSITIYIIWSLSSDLLSQKNPDKFEKSLLSTGKILWAALATRSFCVGYMSAWKYLASCGCLRSKSGTRTLHRSSWPVCQ